MESAEGTTSSHTEKRRALDSVAAYRLATEASDAAWDDATAMKSEPLLAEVAPQLVRAIGSISANIGEGYSRKSPRDRIRFYEYALGSVEEARSWYQAGRRILTEPDLSDRTKRFDSIRRLLLVMLKNERRGEGWNHERKR
jgi:four helix bundle protein